LKRRAGSGMSSTGMGACELEAEDGDASGGAGIENKSRKMSEASMSMRPNTRNETLSLVRSIKSASGLSNAGCFANGGLGFGRTSGRVARVPGGEEKVKFVGVGGEEVGRMYDRVGYDIVRVQCVNRAGVDGNLGRTWNKGEEPLTG